MKIIPELFLCVLFSVVGFGQTVPKVQHSGNTIVGITNGLGKVERMVCKLPKTFIGTIVKRNFENDRITLAGFVLSDSKDNRHSINLNNSQLELLGHYSVPIIASLLEEGHKVRVSAFECSGGSGVFLYADKIRLNK